VTSDQPDPQAILNLPLAACAADSSGATTVRGYLTTLLTKLWREGECFSGKRPFGNSGWHYDLHETLVTAGMISGSFDEDGYLEDCDSSKGHRLVAGAIRALGGTA
jgi:hypothetical protein